MEKAAAAARIRQASRHKRLGTSGEWRHDLVFSVELDKEEGFDAGDTDDGENDGRNDDHDHDHHDHHHDHHDHHHNFARM